MVFERNAFLSQRLVPLEQKDPFEQIILVKFAFVFAFCSLCECNGEMKPIAGKGFT